MSAGPQTPPYHRSVGHSSSSPSRSSPLNPNYKQNNPPSQRRPGFKNQFRTSSRYARAGTSSRPLLPPPVLAGDGEPNGDSAQKALWRERFLQRYTERVEKDRQKRHNIARRGLSNPPSATGDTDDDEMEVDGSDGLDTELMRRLIRSEKQREKRAFDASYRNTFGSSFDPTMEDIEAMEQELNETGFHRNAPPTAEYEGEEDLDDYVDLQLPEHDDHHSDIFKDTDMDLSSPPASPLRKSPSTPSTPRNISSATLLHSSSPFFSALLDLSCPFCSAPYSLHLDGSENSLSLSCAVCTTAIPLGPDLEPSWRATHPVSTSSHTPLLMADSSISESLLLICADDDCSWGFTL